MGYSTYSSKVIVIQIIRKDRQTDQWNRIESPEIDLHSDRSLIINKDSKKIKWGKNNCLNKWSGTVGQTYERKKRGGVRRQRKKGGWERGSKEGKRSSTPTSHNI